MEISPQRNGECLTNMNNQYNHAFLLSCSDLKVLRNVMMKIVELTEG